MLSIITLKNLNFVFFASHRRHPSGSVRCVIIRLWDTHLPETDYRELCLYATLILSKTVHSCITEIARRIALRRYLDVIIDLSRAAQMADFRPSRLALMARAPSPCSSEHVNGRLSKVLRSLSCVSPSFCPQGSLFKQVAPPARIHWLLACLRHCETRDGVVQRMLEAAEQQRRCTSRAGVLQRFIREFFDQNPLSHLGVVAMRNGTAQRLTELSASPVCKKKKKINRAFTFFQQAFPNSFI